MDFNQSRSQLKANTVYQIQLAAPVDSGDLRRVFQLYLPFISNDAYVLYHFLVDEGQVHQERTDHNVLLDSLNLSLPDLIKNQQRLEAVGLLKTFEQPQNQNGYIYQVLPPLSARSFFKENLLAGLLYKFVGEQRFNTLRARFGLSRERLAVGRELSAKFLQVFEPSDQPAVPVDQPIPEGAVSVDQDELNFNFDLFTSMVQGTTPTILAQHRHFLISQQVLYGLNEKQLATAVTRTVRLDDHQVDQGALQNFLRQTWGRPQTRLSQEQKAPVAKDSDSAPANGGSESLNNLYKAATSLAPLPFLSQLKANQNGFVSNGERRLLTDLIEQNILPVPVINILVYQVIIGMGNASLNRNLVDAIANNWAKNQVGTVQEAVQEIKKRQNQSQTRKSFQKGTQRYQRPTKVEPSFVKSSSADQPKHNQQDVDQAMARLKQMKTKN